MMTIEKARKLVDLINELFPGQMTSDTDLVDFISQKLNDYRLMTEHVFGGVKLSELMLRNTFLIGQWNHLDQLKGYHSQILIKKPQDLGAMTKLAKIENDLEIIRPAANAVNQQILDLIEKESGKEFKYLPTTKNVEKSSPLTVQK